MQIMKVTRRFSLDRPTRMTLAIPAALIFWGCPVIPPHVAGTNCVLNSKSRFLLSFANMAPNQLPMFIRFTSIFCIFLLSFVYHVILDDIVWQTS